VAASRQDLKIRHPAAVTRTLHRRLPVVPLPQALLPAAAALRHDTLRLVLARAEFHNLLSLSTLQASLGSGHAGSRALRIAMDAHLPQLARCVTQLERDFVLLCERLRLPLPEPNERIGRYRPDMLWREAMLIVELDGKDAHHTSAQIAADLRRQEVLEALGYTVLRFDWAAVHGRPEQVAAEVRRHLWG
jgi:very-short-patch-repair endonuclease